MRTLLASLLYTFFRTQNPHDIYTYFCSPTTLLLRRSELPPLPSFLLLEERPTRPSDEHPPAASPSPSPSPRASSSPVPPTAPDPGPDSVESSIASRLHVLQVQQQSTYSTLLSLRLEQLTLRQQQLAALQTLLQSELYGTQALPLEVRESFYRLERLIGIVLGDLQFAVRSLESLTAGGAPVSSSLLRELADRDDLAEQVSKLARASLAVHRMLTEEPQGGDNVLGCAILMFVSTFGHSVVSRRRFQVNSPFLDQKIRL